MTAKEYLGQLKSISMSIQRLSQQVDSLNETLTGASPLMSNMPCSPAPDVRRMEKLLAAKHDLMRKIDVQSTRLTEIFDTINSLPNHVHSTILTARYVRGMDWRDIENTLRISRSHLFQQHNNALKEIDKLRTCSD